MNEEASEVTEVEQSETAAEQPESEPTVEETVASQPLPDEHERWALIEAVVYVSEEPLQPEHIAEGLGFPLDVVKSDLVKLIESYSSTSRGIEMRQVAGGCKMFTKAEHHDAVRSFVKTLQTKVRLSLPALETLSVIAYKQPITLPEIQAIRGVNAGGVVHTLLKHKLIATAGRKKVIGKPMQYKTTREFLVQFGLDSVSELPNLNELEELSRAALGEEFEEQPKLPGVADADVPDAAESKTANNDSESDASRPDDTTADEEE